MQQPRQTPPWNILLAVDGSENALAACHLLCDLQPSPESCIHVVSVLVPRHAAEHYSILENVLNRTQGVIEEKGYRADTELLTGYPAEMLVDYADQHRPDLIVIGAKGLRGTIGILLGGVAQQVVEYASAPVLVVRTPYTGLRRALLVIDKSAYSQEAISYLLRMPLPDGVELQVMHVLPPLVSPILDSYAWPSEAAMPLPPPDLEEEISRYQAEQAETEKHEGQGLLDRAIDMLAEGGLQATGKLVRGDAATEILNHAKERSVDLIIAGSRGLSRMQGLLLGSVSRKLVHYAHCSVTIVKGPEAVEA